MNLLEVHDLRKIYPLAASRLLRLALRHRPMLHAVDGVTLSIGRGEAVGLVGESGCGKSTLAQIVCRLADPTGGRVVFDGHDVSSIPAADFARSALRSRIQMVFQDADQSLNPRYSAYESIAHPLRRLLRLAGSQLLERVHEAAALAGLPVELLSRFPHQLSGGQKARVDIARAISTRPDLLVLDEPTAALDVSVQALILKTLAGLRDKLGMSMLFVSHDIEVVRMLCDRVVVMYLGKVVEEGSVRNVLSLPRHPYSIALLESVPSFDRRPSRENRLDGDPQSAVDPIQSACRLVGRCPHARARCRSEAPQLFELDTGHRVACHFPRPLMTERSCATEPRFSMPESNQPPAPPDGTSERVSLTLFRSVGEAP